MESQAEWYYICDLKDSAEGNTVQSLSLEQLRRHCLIVGSTASGPVKLLENFLPGYINSQRLVSIFDSTDQLTQFLAQYEEFSSPWAVILDSTSQRVLGFDPFRFLSDWGWDLDCQFNQLMPLILEAAEREQIELEAPTLTQLPDFFSGLIARVMPSGSYFAHSFSQASNDFDFSHLLTGRRNFWARLSRLTGSYFYGLLLFDALLSVAEQVEVKNFHLIVVNDAFSFLGQSLLSSLKRLSQNNIGLLITVTYQQLGWLKHRDPALYRALLNDLGSIIACGCSDSDPREVIHDVADCMLKRQKEI